MEEILDLNETSNTQKVKIAWQYLTAKTKNCAKLTLTPGLLTTYQNSKNTLLLKNLVTNFTFSTFYCIPQQENHLHNGKEPSRPNTTESIISHSKIENNLDFTMRKLELISKIKLSVTQKKKVELILVRMRPRIQERLETKQPYSIPNLNQEVITLEVFRNILKEQSKIRQANSKHQQRPEL